MHDVAVKLVVTPLLVGGASLAGRRWGHHVGGWLVALPLTSGPIAFFLANDHGAGFAGRAVVGMLAGTVSQVAFALAYRALAARGCARALVVGCAGFAATTFALSMLHWPVIPTFALTCAVLGVGIALSRRAPRPSQTESVAAPRWDIPVRMTIATAIVLVITGLAPVIGPELAGLLSPFPVFGAVVAVMAHRVHGARAASASIEGLVMGLAAPAVFFLVLALALASMGMAAFALAVVITLVIQATSMLMLPHPPRDEQFAESHSTSRPRPPRKSR